MNECEEYKWKWFQGPCYINYLEISFPLYIFFIFNLQRNVKLWVLQMQISHKPCFQKLDFL